MLFWKMACLISVSSSKSSAFMVLNLCKDWVHFKCLSSIGSYWRYRLPSFHILCDRQQKLGFFSIFLHFQHDWWVFYFQQPFQHYFWIYAFQRCSYHNIEFIEEFYNSLKSSIICQAWCYLTNFIMIVSIAFILVLKLRILEVWKV